MDRHQELRELQRGWKAPSELASSTPRDVELSCGGKAVAVLAAALFLGAIGSAIGLSRVAARQASESEAIRNGIETRAVVTRHWRTSGEDSKRRIAYEFEHQGRRYARSINTPRAIWARLEVGSTVPVRFVPERPELNHPVEWRTSDMPWFIPGLTAAGLVAVGILLIWLIRRQIALLSDGRAAAAVVTAHKRGQHGSKSIVYEFPLYGGGVGKGNGGESRKPPPIGSTLTVVYDRERPGRNAIYPMSMVRVVR
jgi:hypothetical protein